AVSPMSSSSEVADSTSTRTPSEWSWSLDPDDRMAAGPRRRDRDPRRSVVERHRDPVHAQLLAGVLRPLQIPRTLLGRGIRDRRDHGTAVLLIGVGPRAGARLDVESTPDPGARDHVVPVRWGH